MNENLKKLFDILLSNNPSILIRENEDYIFNIIPELRKSKGFNQNNPWHIYDVYDHILHVIDGVKENIILRLVALFHDIGKPYTYMEDENNIGHFYDHWTKSSEIFLNFSKKYELPEDLNNEVKKLIYYHDINISKLDREELNKFLDEFSVDEINMLYEIKKSDLLAQSPKYHYLITEYDLQKENLLRKKIVRWKFCSDNEKLISLVLSGDKRATTSLYNEYIKNKEPLPKIGEKSIIQHDNNNDACLIEIEKVIITEFKNITEELAFIEGEGDKSLEYYRNVHYKIFKNIDSNFSDESKVVFEIFRVIENYN